MSTNEFYQNLPETKMAIETNVQRCDICIVRLIRCFQSCPFRVDAPLTKSECLINKTAISLVRVFAFESVIFCCEFVER